MSKIRPLRTSVQVLLGTLLALSAANAELPGRFKIDGVARVKQQANYCGPAAMESVFRAHGKKLTQETIGQEIYDAVGSATNGADMLLYAREHGFRAYSWNSSISDAKRKIAAGVPVIVLQQNSLTDSSGHYRVLVGYDDTRSVFHVVDPYYDKTEMSYSESERLWNPMGHWALLITPKEKDRFKNELDTRNPVVHMDLSYARYKRKDYQTALAEANLALKLEPGNRFALALVDKITRAISAQ